MTAEPAAAKYPIVSDPDAMTITVGPRVFDRPRLAHTPETHTSLKDEICDGAPWHLGMKATYQFFASHLGCKFNRRFQAANYWLWLGDRMTARTANMLRRGGRHWYHYDDALVWRAHLALPYVKEAEEDGLFHLIPAIVTFGTHPQNIRRLIGRGAWRRVANNSTSRNCLIMQAVERDKAQDRRAALFTRLLEVPSGVLPYVTDAGLDELVAARIAPRKRFPEYVHTLHIVRDTHHMVGAGFNPRWSFARMAAEHERATKAYMRGKFSEQQFAPAWTYQADGYSASLVTCQFDIAAEGHTQHHCIASYARRASKGKYAVLKIEGKERATAGLILGAGVRVDQVYAACNGHVSDACHTFVHRAAREYGAQARSIAA